MMKFRNWLRLTENSSRTGAKLGLYPTISDALGQYPPLYGMPSAADLITYIDIEFGGWQNVPGQGGIIRYSDERKHRPGAGKPAKS